VSGNRSNKETKVNDIRAHNHKEATTRKGTPLELDNGLEKWRINNFRGSMRSLKYFVGIGDYEFCKGTYFVWKQDVEHTRVIRITE
jgi:hypothetical protein